jgi:hypothetical protein
VTLVPWATLDDLPADRATLPGGDEAWTQQLAAASEVLYALTGRRYAGLRERAVELYAPCRCGGLRIGARIPAAWVEYAFTGGEGFLGSYAYDPYSLPAGVWGSCRPHEIRLPNRDARELLAARDAAGAPLDATRYRIGRGGYLLRAPGVEPDDAPLPGCRRPLRLRYQFGRDPGDAGRAAAVTLAAALGQATVDPEASPLPGTVTQIVRQGVTVTQQTASTLIAQGMTGLPGVDLWIASANPARLRRPARSWSPDTDARYYPIPTEEVP